MKDMLLYIAGVYCYAFVLFHLLFWKLFRWKADLQRLTPVNRAIMQVLNLRLSYIFLVVGTALFAFPESMFQTDVGRFILGAMSVFWFMRAIEQIIFFSAKSVLSLAFIAIFLLGVALFAMPLFM